MKNLVKEITRTLNIVNRCFFNEEELKEMELEVEYLLLNGKTELIEQLQNANELELMNKVVNF